MSRGPEDFGGRPPMQSGAVTAVAVVNFILGILNVVCGVVLFVAANWIIGLFTGAGAQATQGMSPEEAQKAQEALGLLGKFGTAAGAILGGCSLVFGLLYIFAGVGVMGRKQYGRILTIILGILSAIVAVVNLISFNLIGLVVSGGYAVFVLIVMFSGKYAAEFRP
jgi:hypothetical protein